MVYREIQINNPIVFHSRVRETAISMITASKNGPRVAEARDMLSDMAQNTAESSGVISNCLTKRYVGDYVISVNDLCCKDLIPEFKLP